MTNNLKVHTHRTDERGFAVNSYLVETENGVIAIDTPFLLSDARSFRASLDAIGKPLLAVLVTHAHPDHVNGIATLVAGSGDVPIVATAAVDGAYRDSAESKRVQWTPIYGEDYPPAAVFPNLLVEDGGLLAYDGVVFRTRELGAGESVIETIWVVDDARIAFIGDLAYNHVHSYLLEGRTRKWLRQLERGATLLPEDLTLYPGHGDPAGRKLLDGQRSYLQTYRATVDTLRDGGATVSPAAQDVLDARMATFLPDAPLRMLVRLGADPVAAELAGETS